MLESLKTFATNWIHVLIVCVLSWYPNLNVSVLELRLLVPTHYFSKSRMSRPEEQTAFRYDYIYTQEYSVKSLLFLTDFPAYC